MPLAPLAHGLGHRPERLTVLGQRILDTRRNLGEHLALDDAVGLELPQLTGEHTVTDAGRLAPIAEVWEKLGRAAADVEVLNLDRKPLVFAVFGHLAETARR